MDQLNTVYPRIEAAIELVTAEIDTIETEKDAFESFRTRLRHLEPNRSASVGNGGTLTTASSFQGVDPRAVRAAYRDTVLAMDHYEDDYGEPLLDNVEIEFGESVRAVFATDMPIPPMNRAVVETATEQAINERDQFLRALTDERDSLRRINDQLGEIERDLHHLSGLAPDGSDNEVSITGRLDRLGSLADDSQALSVQRQRTLQRRPTPTISGIDDGSLVEYLYSHRDHRFPALVEITNMAERIESAMYSIAESGLDRRAL